jgi:hypothetical protein
MTPRNALLIALGTFVLALALCDRMLAWYAPRHFIPEARLEAALAKGPGCVVVAGDSRMVAGFDRGELEQALAEKSPAPCLATMAIGALRIQGMQVALREYVERGGRPQLIALGAAEETLLGTAEPLDPAAFIGNEAILLAWSHASDVLAFFPGFPFENVHRFDQGLRFLLARSTAFGTYLSLAWQRIQAFQDRLTGRPLAVNAFGALADMEASGRRMEAAAPPLLESALSRPEPERLDPAFGAILALTRAVNARLVVVELPMPASYRQHVTNAPAGTRYLTWLDAYLRTQGATWVNLTHPPWLSPEHFADFVHLNAEGARLFSRDLGRAINQHR